MPSLQDRYKRSAELFKRASKVIPLASQTFSKSYIQYPLNAAPMFLDRGKGGRVWDVDGNEYVDLVCGLLPIVLGYCDPAVDGAITKQLSRGISFSLATELETQLAERLVDIIPCAEAVRFGKNGTDATSAAVRIARAFTGRDRIAVAGYHGWQDWYIGSTTRNKGIPDAVGALTHKFAYNDLNALDQLLSAHKGEFAAVILEPMNAVVPADGYLAAVKDLTHKHGALLVFDEVITGFRYALGGAQEYFGVTPDMASFGKAMANGMPLSAIVGRADLLDQMNEIFLSSTFGGEALSLAASIAVIDKMRAEPVIETLWRTGEQMSTGALERIGKHGLSDVIGLAGVAPWRLLTFKDHAKASKEAIKTLFLREMLLNGVLIAASHNVCYAHDARDIEQVMKAYDASLAVVAAELEGGRLAENLGGPPIHPIFTVR